MDAHREEGARAQEHEFETLRLAMRGARMGSWMRDLRTDEMRWSPEFERLLGLSPGALGCTRGPFYERVHPEDAPRLRAAVDAAVASGQDYSAEFRFRDAQGQWRWMSGRGHVEHDAEGRPLRLHGVALDITEKKRAEDARDWLAAIVESSTAAIISKRLDGTITSWNAGAVRLFGYSAEEIVGTSIYRLVPPELHAEEDAVLRRLGGGERIDGYETVRIARDGRRRHVALAVAPVRNAAGEIVGASKIAFGIDERVEAERRLREEAHALELLNDVGRAVAAELDLERLVQLVTDTATELTGAQFGAFFYNVEDEHGARYTLYTLSGVERSSFEQFPMPRSTALFSTTFRGEGIVRCDDVRQDPRFGQAAPFQGMPEGHLPVVSYLAVPVMGRSGEVLGGLFFGHGEPARFTLRAERIAAGIAAQAAIAIDNARLYREAQREIAARTAAEAALRESELRLKAIAAERESLLASERAARAEAERLSHVKDEFLATLSHELRTPLNAIQGWAVLLRQPQLAQADRDRGLATIERNTRAQAQIVNDLLDMSRIVSGKVHLEVHPVRLHEVIEAAMEAVRPAADARRVTLSALLDSTLGPIRGDPNRLQQVMWNLLSNAVKFTPAGGRVQVILERVASHIEILVQDTGIGIAPEFLPHVFERFRQADSSTTRSYGGLGLGLSIVRNLVELHGGSVHADSAGEGHGSSFKVCLPLSLASAPRLVSSGGEPPGAPEPPSDGELPRLDGVRVLVVDDERDTRELLQKIFEARGARIAAAGSAREALEVLDREHFDLMVSDIGMPGADGYELIRHVRERDKGRAAGPLPAIAATAYARAEDRQRSLMAGYQLHVAKPIEPRELVAAAASLMRLRA